VKRVLVHEGEMVKAGQLLVQLDDANARATAAKAEAQLRAAEADLHAIQSGGTREELLANQSQLTKAQAEVEMAQRNLTALQRLQEKGAASAAEVTAAQNRLNTAQADLQLAEQKKTSRYSTPEIERVRAAAAEARATRAAAQDLLARSDVRAPREGMVYSLPVRAGEFVNVGDLLVQVGDLTTVEVVAYVDEPDLGRLRASEPVQIRWDALPGREWQGTVTRIPTTVVNVGSRNVGQITCQVNNADLKLLPNTNVSVNIVTAQADDAIILPRETVHEEDGHRFIYKVVDGKLRRQEVQTAITNLTDTQITQGVAENLQVALGTANAQPLREGMPVKIVNP
jgi:HlyD family secretion protein